MSLSSIRTNPSIEDPSNMMSPERALSNWLSGTSTFLLIPVMSVNCRRRKSPWNFLVSSSTSAFEAPRVLMTCPRTGVFSPAGAVMGLRDGTMTLLGQKAGHTGRRDGAENVAWSRAGRERQHHRGHLERGLLVNRGPTAVPRLAGRSLPDGLRFGHQIGRAHV